LRRAVGVRYGLSILGLLALLTFPSPGSVTYYVTLAVVLAGELAERYLFFRAVDAPKMPGVPRA
jgi:DMSO reductase anchor subunit